MKREQVKEKYKWKIEDIFSSDEEWEKCFKEAENSLDFAKYSGKLSSKTALLKLLKENDEYSKTLTRLAVYAHMRNDEDRGVSKYSAYNSKVGALWSKYATELSFYEPEMAMLDNDYLNSLIYDKDFYDYDYDIKRIIKGKPHVISEAEERLIGMAGEVLDSFYESFGMIDNLDLPLPEIEWEGKTTKLTHG
ncbi:MAG: hypothetical protein K2K38_02310, partial [Clostridia bacterium]|nr:hypothetical protein [Clostridia bacterium]